MDVWQPPSSLPPTEGPLVDTFGRVADDLRVSVTDRCNFRCTYCMPAEGLAWLPKHEILTFEELTRLLGLFVHRLGDPLGQGHRWRAHRPGRSAHADPDVPRGRARDRPVDDHERRAARPSRGTARRGGPRPRDGLAGLAAAAPVRGDDPSRRARPGARRHRGRRGGRAGPDQDQLRRDRRDQRRRGRRPRALVEGARLHGPVHRVHAARRAARVGAREGRSRRPGSSRRSTPSTRSSPRAPTPSPRRAIGSPTARRAGSA